MIGARAQPASRIRLVAAVLAIAVLAGAHHPTTGHAAPPRPSHVATGHPFALGERAEYDVRFGPLHVGSGTIQIEALDSVRGVTTFHAVLAVRGGLPFFRVEDRFESWFDTLTLTTLRARQHVREGRYRRDRSYDIDPSARRVVTASGDTLDSVEDPLDETAFLYFARTLPLTTGAVYRVPRFFLADRNPIELRVVRRERVSVPAGDFDAVVVQPVFKTTGVFSERGHAQVWLSDDATRRLLQIKASVSFGSLSLQLRRFDSHA
jgi:Protein of unknown function (DUF3108)